MATLKTNYKDDVLDIAENVNRKFNMIENEDNSVSFEDVSVYSQTGDEISALDMNATNTQINKNTKNVPWYASCATGASTAAKVVSTADASFSLVAGAKIAIKFSSANTAASPTLNVDGTGARSITRYGTVSSRIWWQANEIVQFVYDGSAWIMVATISAIDELDGTVESLSSTVNSVNTNTTNKVKVNGSNVTSVNFQLSGTSLTITTT